MQLHHQPVLGGHPRHLEQHVPRERLRVRGADLAPQRGRDDPLGLADAQRRGVGREVPVVGRARAGRDERAPPLLQRAHQVAVPADGDTRPLLQQGDVRAPAGPVDVQDGVRPERRHDPLAPAAGRQIRVVGEGGRRRVGRRQDLEAEACRTAPAGGTRASRAARTAGRTAGRRTRPTAARRRRTPRPARARASSASVCRGTAASGWRTCARPRAGPRPPRAGHRAATPSASCGTPCDTSIRTR